MLTLSGFDHFSPAMYLAARAAVKDHSFRALHDLSHQLVAFFHCGPRHHSLAIVQLAAPRRLHHFMLQVCQLRDVGSAFDRCRDEAVPIRSELGCHTNDRMVSFYAETPSGFQVEYGHGGVEIDDDTWQVETYRAASSWGHRAPVVPVASVASVAAAA